jgi:hypothetical protein
VVASVNVTLTTQAAGIDPQTQQFVVETKSLAGLAPRNIQVMQSMAGGMVFNFLQPLPAGLPLSPP